ncbi:hypothetical protein JH06_2314 [Blastocystis sp. subtype 4]|uniref:hypothetical protein n=1 Tax=Blastocystis sp. subtype 4 TaxID=944170 RepID=UPI000711D34B|nr:hypothetical protein JH06_2314 [Blastocystis sp. subtype 4]KNB45277.1 hypothetical protein JH06_2314 [Blastocystis sp. subtype 4]|eukprot:XP_014528720.1 hypothetical protein JH06_2314 [Blastocystis sp. subtype 4]
MIVPNRDNVIDATVYESRFIGTSKKQEYVLVGVTEVIVQDPKTIRNLQQESESQVRRLSKHSLIGTFQCSLDTLTQCPNYYTTCLSPVNTPIFGSIQIYAEKNSEDRNTTTLSLSVSPLACNPSHVYLELFRLCDNGVRVPIYRSKTFDKMNRVATIEDDDASDDEKSPEEETHTSIHSSSSYRLFTKLSSKKFTGGYSFGSIELPNQVLICGNKHAKYMKLSPKDVICILGIVKIPATTLLTASKGTSFELTSNPEKIRLYRTQDATIAKGNNEAVADFRRLVNSTVSSVSASALNLVNLNQENLPDDSNVLFADLIPSLSTSGEVQGAVMLDDISSKYKYSFFDYRHVTDMDFIIAVDMSSSVKQASISSHRNPDYEEALLDVGTVLSRYDDDNTFAVYGFGGAPLKRHYHDYPASSGDKSPLPESIRQSVEGNSEDVKPDEIPIKPTESAEPVEPDEIPIEPTKPTDSAQPDELVEPSEPTEPTQPTESIEPTQPTESTQPDEPVEPTEPTESTKPTEPTEAKNSTQPLEMIPETVLTEEQQKEEEKRKALEMSLTASLAFLKENTTPQTETKDFESAELSVELFPMNGNPSDPYIHGTNAVLKAYRAMVKNLLPSYPTYFQHILRKAIERAKEAETKKGKEYVVLILLSDCGIVDQVETARLVIEASHLPLSLIILGMGDNDFQFMNVLDGDDRTLSFNGEKPARDMVQFVKFEELRYKSCEEIIENLLFELPRQFMDYMNAHGYSPENIGESKEDSS